MHLWPSLRRTRTVARFMLVWFALSLGVAMASPLVNPQSFEMICSGGGVMKMLVKADDGTSAEVQMRMADCPLCVSVGAPPPEVTAAAAPAQPLAVAVQSVPSALIAALTSVPPPARGPPDLIS
jgi:hypothetical protein